MIIVILETLRAFSTQIASKGLHPDIFSAASCQDIFWGEIIDAVYFSNYSFVCANFFKIQFLVENGTIIKKK